MVLLSGVLTRGAGAVEIAPSGALDRRGAHSAGEAAHLRARQALARDALADARGGAVLLVVELPAARLQKLLLWGLLLDLKLTLLHVC